MKQTGQQSKRKATGKNPSSPPVKRGKSKASSSSSERFINDEAKGYYTLYAKKSMHPQRVVLLIEEEMQMIRDKVDARGWHAIVNPGHNLNRTWLREFYANLRVTIQNNSKASMVKVRGKEVDFSPANLRVFLELANDGNDTQLLISKDLRPLGQFISPPGVIPDWMNLPQRKLRLHHSHLTDEMHIWNDIIHSNIQPSSRAHQITKERIDTLFRIASGAPVNIGHLIWINIIKTAKQGNQNMIFPQLITQLCSKAEVPAWESDVWMENEEPPISWAHFVKQKEAAKLRLKTKTRKKDKYHGQFACDSPDEPVEEPTPTEGPSTAGQSSEGDGYGVFEEEVMRKGDTTKKGFYGAFNGLLDKVKGMFTSICKRLDDSDVVSEKRHQESVARQKELLRRTTMQASLLKRMQKKVERLERQAKEAHSFHYYASLQGASSSNPPPPPPFMDPSGYQWHPSYTGPQYGTDDPEDTSDPSPQQTPIPTAPIYRYTRRPAPQPTTSGQISTVGTDANLPPRTD